MFLFCETFTEPLAPRVARQTAENQRRKAAGDGLLRGVFALRAFSGHSDWDFHRERR